MTGSWNAATGTASLFATTTEATNNNLVAITDSGATPTTYTTLANAGANFVYRGVDLTPIASNPPTAPLVSATNTTCGGSNGAIDVTVTNAVTTQWTGPNGFTASTVDLSNLAPGTYDLTVTGAGGATATLQVVVLATPDTTLPSITSCAGDQAVLAGAGCQAAVPDFTAFVAATDDCGAVTVTQSPTVGTVLGLGVHAITLTVRDGSNNAATCSANLTISSPDSDGDGTVDCADGCPADPARTTPATWYAEIGRAHV